MIDNGSTEIHLNQILKSAVSKIFRNLKLFIGLLGVWALLTIIFLVMPKTKYFLTYSISSDYMSGQKIELIYSDIKKFISGKQHQRLAELLNLPVEEVKNLKDFKITIEEPSASLLNYNDIKPNFHFNETNAIIQITLTDTTNNALLVPAFNQFISSSNYFKKIRKNELISMEKINERLEAEKKELDSINQINLRKFTQSSGSLLLLNDLSQIKQNIYLIEERLINNRRGMIMIEEPVNIISHPIVYKQSILAQILIAAGKGFAIAGALFLALFIVLWIRKNMPTTNTIHKP
jgi:hypothetical protein